MDEKQRREYEHCLEWGKEYERTGNSGVFIRDSRLEALKQRGRK